MSDEILGNAFVEDAAEDSALTRRQALTHAVKRAAGAGLLLLLPMASETVHADTAHSPTPPDTTSWPVIGKAAQFVKGQPQRIALANGGVMYVTRLTPTTLSAVSAKCTHRGCEIGWHADVNQLVCPCHGAAFDSTGKNLHGTTHHPEEALPALPSVPIVQKNGKVLANIKAVPTPSLIPGH